MIEAVSLLAGIAVGIGTLIVINDHGGGVGIPGLVASLTLGVAAFCGSLYLWHQVIA